MLQSRWRPAVLFVALALSLTGPGALAQDAPEATPGGPSGGYPVAVHEGTCDAPNAEPVWQADDAVAIGVDQDEPDVIGVEITRTVATTSGTLEMSLDDLAGSEHVVAVHASPDQFGTIVACGQVAGIRDEDKLVIALAQVGDSEVTGVAILEGDDQVELTVYLIVPSEEDVTATPIP